MRLRADTPGVSSLRDRLRTAGAVLLLAAVAVALARVTWDAPGTGDYAVHKQVMADNAAPAITALIHGHLIAAVRLQPLMGLTSLIWRAPFAAAALLLGGGDARVYEVGCLACLLPLTGLIGWLGRRAGDRAHLGAVALAAAALVAGPATSQALQFGHPEELLAGALVTGAVLCASAQRRGWAAVLLGLAIGTKQWALLTVPCVLLAVPDGRVRMVVRATLVAAPLTLVLPLADPAAFSKAGAYIGGIHFVAPMSAWWPVAVPSPGVSATLDHLLPFGLTRTGAMAIGLGLAAVAIVGYGRLGGAGRRSPVDGLALLALVCLLRCALDPAPVVYYFVPAVLALAAWEVHSLRRLPVVTIAFSAWLALLPTMTLDPGTFDAVWLAGMVVLAIHLARGALRPAVAPADRAALPGLPPLLDAHPSA
jgi:hypothetical protein